jgi:hypothetical protein
MTNIDVVKNIDAMNTISQVAEVAFQDLLDLSDDEPEIFEYLFFDREQQYGKLQSIILNSHNSRANILVTGEAGVGKSNFLYKFLRDKQLLEERLLYPILVDYRKIAPLTWESCINSFIDQMKTYFDNIKQPINTLQENHSQKYIDSNTRAIYNHLHSIPSKQLRLRAIIVLDDFDYMEHEWVHVLKYLLPFAASNKSSTLLSARPPLLAAIDAYDERFSQSFIRNVQHVHLPCLDAGRIVTYRLACILMAGKADTVYQRIIMRLQGERNPLYRLFRKRKIELSKLVAIEYPFTESHNNFMSLITNGNLREIFDIAWRSLLYIYDPNTIIASFFQDEIERRVITSEAIMQMFYDEHQTKASANINNPNDYVPASGYKLLNLHMRRSTLNNSLLFNALECIKHKHTIDEQFYSFMSHFGHSQKQVDWAIDLLVNKEQRLISPVRAPNNHGQKGGEYQLTDKGDYYLQMCQWPEYQKRFGQCGKSFYEEMYVSKSIFSGRGRKND